jgi:hypothetical protein
MRSIARQPLIITAALCGGALLLALSIYKYNVAVDDAAAWSSGSAGGGAGPTRAARESKAPAGGAAAPRAARDASPPRSPGGPVRVAAVPLALERSFAPALDIPAGDTLPVPAVLQDAGYPRPPWSTAGEFPSAGPLPFPSSGGGGGPGTSGPRGADPGTGGGLPFWPWPFFPVPGGGDGTGDGGPVFYLPWWGGPMPDGLGAGPGLPVAAVPEATTWTLLAAGLLVLLGAVRGRKPRV